MSQNTFSIDGITKAYGNRIILDNISISANPGQAIGILGTNGSGKSTLLTYIAKNAVLSKDNSIGYIPQENPLFDELKPIDNIKMWTKMNKTEILNSLSSPAFSKLGILDFLDTPVKKMSGGMKKRLSIATVLLSRPSILLMDEPFSALDLIAKNDILSFMGAFLQSGGIILVASHDEGIFNFCNKVYLLKDGKLTDTAELRAKNINYVDILRG